MQGAAPTLPEVERKFQIQIMVLSVRPAAIPGTGVHCARAPGWRLPDGDLGSREVTELCQAGGGQRSEPPGLIQPC